MNCNVEITAVGTADGLEVSIHGGSVGMMTAAELIVARVLMAVADDEENLAGLKDSMFEIRSVLFMTATRRPCACTSRI